MEIIDPTVEVASKFQKDISKAVAKACETKTDVSPQEAINLLLSAACVLTLDNFSHQGNSLTSKNWFLDQFEEVWTATLYVTTKRKHTNTKGE